MGQIITSISFNNTEPAYKVYKAKFEDNEEANFSAWVKKALLELAEKEANPDFLRNKIAALEADRSKIESELALHKKQLDNVMVANSVKVTVEQEGNKVRKRRIDSITQIIKSDFLVPAEQVDALAMEWVDEVMNDRDLQDKFKVHTIWKFMAHKGFKEKEKEKASK